MGAFLQIDEAEKGKIFRICCNHYILGMKRIGNGTPYQQSEFAQNREFQALCFIHGEINNYEYLVQECLPGDSKGGGEFLNSELYNF
jgi:hypothetical protein